MKLKKLLKVQDTHLNSCKKATIIYFSATGNTLKIVKDAENFLRSTGYEVIVNSFDSNFIPSFRNISLIIIIFPVVFGTTYRFITQSLNAFPQVNGINTITACTFGGYAPGLMDKVNNVLINKGYKTTVNLNLKTPSIYKKNMITESDIQQLDTCSDLLIETLDRTGLTLDEKYKGHDTGVLNLQEDRDLWNKLHEMIDIVVDRKKCTKCGKCVELCPTNCIDDANMKPDSSMCDLCFRCFLYCPVNAISINGLDIFRNTLFTGNKINYSNGYTNENKKETE